MNDLDILQKKQGMTIGKAWILMIIAILLWLLFTFLYGLFFALNKQENSKLSMNILLFSLSFSVIIMSVWGYYINKKELPYQIKPQPKIIILYTVLISIAFFYINTLAYDFIHSLLPEYSKMSLFNESSIWFSGLLSSITLCFLQIGIIGHGLLRNYSFKKAAITTAFASIVMITPVAVILLIFQSLILLYIYYRTASFKLIFIMSLLVAIPEYLLKMIFNLKNTPNNYLRQDIIQNDTTYYILLLVAVIIIITGLYQIKKLTKPITWQRAIEYDNFEL